jgi:hypothetical protein
MRLFVPLILGYDVTECDYIVSFQIYGKGGQSHIFLGSKGVGVTIESYGKLEISYINVDNF